MHRLYHLKPDKQASDLVIPVSRNKETGREGVAHQLIRRPRVIRDRVIGKESNDSWR